MSTTIEQIMSLVSKLSAQDKLLLNVEVAKSIANVTEKTSSRKGKPAAAGTLAWIAFLAHVQKTMPERFAAPALPKDRMTIAKAIKDEDLPAYEAFCKNFVENMPVAEVKPESDAEVEAKPVDAKPKRVISDEQKAKMKAGRERKAAEKKAAAADSPAEKPKAAATPKAAAKPKATSAKAKAAPVPASVGGGATTEDADMKKIEVDGDTFYLDPSTNNLFGLESDGTLGAFIGRYQPGHADGEIDFDAQE